METHPGEIPGRLDPSLEAQQAGFTDPLPDESDDEWDDPFGLDPTGGAEVRDLNPLDDLIDPPDMLGGQGPIDLSDSDQLSDRSGAFSDDGIDDSMLGDPGP
ncbi:MAG: hypothetical protein ACC658_09015 [Acidimicrobiia bacterium]